MPVSYGGVLGETEQGRLRSPVVRLAATARAFAAVTVGGEAVTWGPRDYGGGGIVLSDVVDMAADDSADQSTTPLRYQ